MLMILGLLTALTGCGGGKEQNTSADPAAGGASTVKAAEAAAAEDSVQVNENETSDETGTEEVKEKMLKMMIGETEVAVTWENYESVEALKALCENEPLVIEMSMYGGFEQVGAIGTDLPSDDVQSDTSAGDIVLYSSSQIVVFYGSNSWAYTRLGHITDQDASGMADLLSNGDVTITISLETDEVSAQENAASNTSTAAGEG